MIKILDYFFSPIPGSPFNFYIPVIILAAVLVIGGFMMGKTIQKKKDDRAFRKIFAGVPATSFWIAFGLFLNIGSRYERFPILGSRFVLYGILGILIYEAYKYIKKYRKDYKRMQMQFHETPQERQYTTHKYR